MAQLTFQKGEVGTGGLLRPGLQNSHSETSAETRPARVKNKMPWACFSVGHMNPLTSCSRMWPEVHGATDRPCFTLCPWALGDPGAAQASHGSWPLPRVPLDDSSTLSAPLLEPTVPPPCPTLIRCGAEACRSSCPVLESLCPAGPGAPCTSTLAPSPLSASSSPLLGSPSPSCCSG